MHGIRFRSSGSRFCCSSVTGSIHFYWISGKWFCSFSVCKLVQPWALACMRRWEEHKDVGEPELRPPRCDHLLTGSVDTSVGLPGMPVTIMYSVCWTLFCSHNAFTLFFTSSTKNGNKKKKNHIIST